MSKHKRVYMYVITNYRDIKQNATRVDSIHSSRRAALKRMDKLEKDGWTADLVMCRLNEPHIMPEVIHGVN